MFRRKSGASKPSASARPEEPRSLIGAYLLARIYADHPYRSWAFPRFRESFPFGAADQEYVGEIVFGDIARERFSEYRGDSEEVDEYAAGLVKIMNSQLRAADMAAAIRAALDQESANLDVDCADLMSIHTGFIKLAAHQLELPRTEVARRFAAAERRAEDEGVWLLPRDGETGETPTFALAADDSGPWDAGQLADPRFGRVDCGSLLVHVPHGWGITINVTDDEVVALEFRRTQTLLQITVYAAGPDGLWDAVRNELADSVRRQCGTARDVHGIGVELWTQVADFDVPPEHRVKHMRVVGKDGPGWMLRGVITWHGVSAQNEIAALEAVFRDIVVVRGDAELADRTRLPLTKPPRCDEV